MADPHAGTSAPDRRAPSWLVPAVLVLADILAFGHAPGLGLVMACALCLAAVALVHRPGPVRMAWAGAGFAIAAAPTLEAAGPVPLAFLVFGTIASGLILAGTDPNAWALKAAIRDHVARAVPATLRDAFGALRNLRRRTAPGRALRNWGPALAFGLAFAALFALANPIIGEVLSSLLRFEGEFGLSWARLAFWAGSAPFVAALLRPRPRAFPTAPASAAGPAPLWLGPEPVRNALIVFNTLFAAQTMLDLTYLWSGAALPEGMTYAQYAHRGAYPLFATTLLAGGFMLAATAFGPPTARNRQLLGLWIAQNLILLASSVLRLELYVQTYALSYLRLATFIWMGLVATGFALMAWRLWRGHSNRWLIARAGLATLVTLYACCFVNFAAFIAETNVALSQEARGEGQPLDIPYLCGLGWQAKPAADIYARLPGARVLPCLGGTTGAGTAWRYTDAPPTRNWQAWGFRHARLSRYLARTATAEAPSVQDPDRR